LMDKVLTYKMRIEEESRAKNEHLPDL